MLDNHGEKVGFPGLILTDQFYLNVLSGGEMMELKTSVLVTV